MKTRSDTTQGQIDKAREERISALEKELARVEALWRRDNEALIDANRDNAKLREALRVVGTGACHIPHAVHPCSCCEDYANKALEAK